MPIFAESELSMWNTENWHPLTKLKDHEIDAKYERGEQRIVTEHNREKLPVFVASLDRPNYMKLNPFYQRRKRWDEAKQSKLIESFIMNIPVPPVFLYERKYSQYEVMDGQQRITAIRSFYNNSLTLTALETWPELNGRTYLTLPPKIKAGVDRRSLSSIVLLKESAPDEEGDWILKRLVFERLNSGGTKLSRQEIRNCLYAGELNDLIVDDLSRNPHLRAAWNIPDQPLKNEETGEPADDVEKDSDYKTMKDCEYVLRFLALRHWAHFSGGMQDFLDVYMIRSHRFSENDLEILKSLFKQTIETCHEIFGKALFRPFDPRTGNWGTKASVSFADAVMVGIGEHIDRKDALIARRNEILQRTKSLFADESPQRFTGSANTKSDVQERIRSYSSMIAGVVK